MLPFMQAASAHPGAMKFPDAQQHGAQAGRAPLRELYPRDVRVGSGIENEPPSHPITSQELIRSIAEREYWRQRDLAREEATRRQDDDNESGAESMDNSEGLPVNNVRNQTFTKSPHNIRDPSFREEQLQNARAYFEDRRARMAQAGSSNTSR